MLLRWIPFLLVVATCWHLAIGGTAAPTSERFETLSYRHIVEDLQALADKYPDLAQVYSAQQRYGLPSPGPCSEDGSVQCEQWVLQVTDHISLQEDPERPEVFFSGCLHGDEQVGPTAVLEAAKLMVYAAVCYADASAQVCDDDVLRNAPESIPWLARLALTRSTVIIPMTNPIGYYNTARTENGLDPNRDFPYRQKADKCMTTITARAVNEVWRNHVFQLAVTFHGGMVGMAYEWGSLNHPHHKDGNGLWQDVSPDDGAQVEITDGLSRFAGSFKAAGKTFEAYPTGRMNELVYPVAGGMEDWAYAGSWDSGVEVCKPSTHGGYPAHKTIYNSATLRAINILVEASDNKHPAQELLGSREGLLDYIPSTAKNANGHVARNVRLTLMVVDLVQPYVQWVPVESHAVDGQRKNGVTSTIVVEPDGLDLEWTVGGAFRVDSTQLVSGPWPENSDSLNMEAWEHLVDLAPAHMRSPALEGRGKWGGHGKEEEGAGETVFRATFEVESEEPSFVVAVATVDQSWAASRESKTSPNVGPQSNFVNARTSQDWEEHSAGHTVRGRLLWMSNPIKVVRRLDTETPPDETETPREDSAEAKFELYRAKVFNATAPPVRTTGKEGTDATHATAAAMLGAVVLIAVGVLAVGLVLRFGKLGRSTCSPRSQHQQDGLALGRTRYGESSAGSRAAPADVNRRRMQEGFSLRDRSSPESQDLLPYVEEAP